MFNLNFTICHDQNGCTIDDLKKFEKLPVKNKIFFTVREDFAKYPNVIKIKAPKSHTFIRASYEPFGNSRYVNINDIICKL